MGKLKPASTKILKFFENVYDPLMATSRPVWIANKEYPVSFEQSDSFWLLDERGGLRGIGKKLEKELYVIIANKER